MSQMEEIDQDPPEIACVIPGETTANPLSKNQQKKAQKLVKYERLKKERRIKEREKQKEKRREAVAQGLPRTGPSRKELKQRQTEVKTDPKALRIAIDMDYDELMSERDVAKAVKQCLRIYTINRRSTRPCQLHFTGIKHNGRIHTTLKKNEGWENWQVHYHFDETHLEAFGTPASATVVYLTCESDTVLDRLEEGMVYVVGGLVDHNHQKGLCHERATKAGLRTARLPLSENVDMKTRSVLSTFHVFELLLRVSAGQAWREAILETLPARKGAKAKSSLTTNPNDAVEEEDTVPSL